VVRDIQIREFNKEDLRSVYRLIQHTIDTSYHEAYPREAIAFFKDYHSKEHILDDAATGYTVVAECNCEVLGTGTLLGINIRRVFGESLGFLVEREDYVPVRNNQKLSYYKMVKTLNDGE